LRTAGVDKGGFGAEVNAIESQISRVAIFAILASSFA
jgi:hypothetical protein